MNQYSDPAHWIRATVRTVAALLGGGSVFFLYVAWLGLHEFLWAAALAFLSAWALQRATEVT